MLSSITSVSKMSSKSGMDRRIGVIDLGTNSFLLLIASFDGREIHTLHEAFKTVRLGEGLTIDNEIHEDAIERAIKVLDDYIEVCKGYNCEKIMAVGTSIFREATNSFDVLRTLMRRCGIKINVLSPDEEGRLSTLGAMNTLNLNGEEDYMCVDVGGGSTEVSYIKRRKIDDILSIPMGALKVSERYSLQPPVTRTRVERVFNVLKRYFETKSLRKGYAMIGIGGTATTLAFIYKGLEEYRADEINGTYMNIGEIEGVLWRLVGLRLEEVSKLTRDMGRAKVIIAGILLILEIMKLSDVKKLLVSSGGLRNGIAYEYFFHS